MAKTPGVPHAFGCFFVFYLLRDPRIPQSNFNNIGRDIYKSVFNT